MANDVAEVATRDEAAERAERIRSGLESYAVLKEDIAAAYLARDWEALSYKTWDAYVTGEFTNARLSLPREERQELVAYFREKGMSTRAIAVATGTDDRTVRRDLAGAAFAAPGRMVGMDGKSYSPHQPEAPRKPEPPTYSMQPMGSHTELPPVNLRNADEIVDAELVDEDEEPSLPPISPEELRELAPRQSERRARTDVVLVINQVLNHAEEAAERAELISKTHLANRNEEAAVWGRRLSSALETLQRLNTSLQEASA